MVDRLWGPDKSPEMAKIANDGLAEVVAKHPDRFVGYSAVVPMNAPEAAAQGGRARAEERRQCHSARHQRQRQPIDGKEFWPLYEAIEKSGKPILLHPARTPRNADYVGEDKSKYEICCVLGWPFETGVTLSRFIFSKIMDTYPKLKIVSHHLGGVIPYLEGRVGLASTRWACAPPMRTTKSLRKSLKKRPFDYFKDFYADTAIEGVRAPMICGIDFFGADHVLFASDCPFDKEKGPGYIRSTIAVLESLDLDAGRIARRSASATRRRCSASSERRLIPPHAEERPKAASRSMGPPRSFKTPRCARLLRMRAETRIRGWRNGARAAPCWQRGPEPLFCRGRSDRTFTREIDPCCNVSPSAQFSARRSAPSDLVRGQPGAGAGQFSDPPDHAGGALSGRRHGRPALPLRRREGERRAWPAGGGGEPARRRRRPHRHRAGDALAARRLHAAVRAPSSTTASRISSSPRRRSIRVRSNRSACSPPIR